MHQNLLHQVLLLSRLSISLVCYAVLGVLTWTTITDPKFRTGTLVVLALFAVKSVLRRTSPKDVAASPKEPDIKALERGQLRMDPERHTCTWKNEAVTLTVTEFLILQALATRPGVVKSRNALMDAAYDDQVYVDDRTIDSHIKRLRKKFKVVDDDFEMIETLYGVGYRFKET